MLFLPRDWWKLSFLWFANLKTRSPRAKRGLFRTSLRVSVLSLAIGVGALSVTLAIVTGFEWTLAKAVSENLGHVVHVSKRWRLMPELERFVATAPQGVVSAEFFWSSQGLIVGPKGGRGVLIEGIRPSRFGVSGAQASLSSQDTAGAPTGANAPLSSIAPATLVPGVKVKLGRALADYLGAEKGKSVRILLPGILKGSIEATVTDLVSKGMYEMDSRFVQIDDASLRDYLALHDPEALKNRPGDAHGIRFHLDPVQFAPDKMPALEKWMADYRVSALKIDPEVEIHKFVSWRDQKNSIFKGIDYNKWELTIVLSLLTLVAALNVAATLVVLFLERDREVAVLQALGLTPGQVLQWVGLQGLILGTVSSALGIGVGRLFGFVLVRLPFAKIPADVYNISVLPLKFEFFEQSRVFAFGILASILVAAVLGLRLSRINLVSVLGSRR